MSHTTEDDLFDQTVGAMEEIAISEAFQDLLNKFGEDHCFVFEDTEENKLEYTAIFTK